MRKRRAFTVLALTAVLLSGLGVGLALADGWTDNESDATSAGFRYWMITYHFEDFTGTIAEAQLDCPVGSTIVHAGWIVDGLLLSGPQPSAFRVDQNTMNLHWNRTPDTTSVDFEAVGVCTAY